MPSTKPAKVISGMVVTCLLVASLLTIIALAKSRLYFAGLENTLQIGFKTTTFCRYDSMGEQVCVTKDNKVIYNNWLWNTNPFSASSSGDGFISSSSDNAFSSSSDFFDVTIGCDQLFILPVIAMYATWGNLLMLAVGAFFGLACVYNQNGGLKCGLVCFTCWVTVNAISVIGILASAANSVCGPNSIMSLADLPTFRYEQSYYLLAVALAFTILGAVLSIVYCCMPHPPLEFATLVIANGAQQQQQQQQQQHLLAAGGGAAYQTVQYTADSTIAVGQPVQQYYQPQPQQQQANGYPVQQQDVYQSSPTTMKQ